jgi:Leucine-rich repeat (LRR) protein
MRLELRRQDVPPWLGELRHLRMLSSAAPTMTRVPDAVWQLPKLRELYLETPALADLEGLIASTSLQTVFLGRTPVGADQAKVDALVAALPV